MKALFLVLLLSGCGLFGGGSRVDPGNPVAITECPATLPEVTGDTFGDAMAKMIEWANQYHRCRKAAIGK